MELTESQISSMLKDIRSQINELEKKASALELVAKMLGADNQVDKKPDDITETGVIDLESLDVDQPKKRKTLGNDIREILPRFGDQEFTVNHVEAVLERMGKAPSGKTPKSRIAMALTLLEREGAITRVFKGRGNVPNRYRQYDSDEKQESESQKNEQQVSSETGVRKIKLRLDRPRSA